MGEGNRKEPIQQTNHNRNNITQCGFGEGGGGGGRTTETNMAVSFTVYSSTPETWYKAIVLSVGTVLSFLSPRGGSKYKVTCVFCKLQRRLVGWWKRGCKFFTLYRSIYYFLVASETKCLLYRILGVVDGKKKKKQNKTKKKKSEKQKKI